MYHEIGDVKILSGRDWVRDFGGAAMLRIRRAWRATIADGDTPHVFFAKPYTQYIAKNPGAHAPRDQPIPRKSGTNASIPLRIEHFHHEFKRSCATDHKLKG